MSDILPRAATFSKGPEFWGGEDWEPAILNGAEGQYVWGNGMRYLDWVSGLGAVLLGHGNMYFADRVASHLYHGTAFSLPNWVEQSTADKIVAHLTAHVPGWRDKQMSVRFGLSGSDACSMAVRLARAATGRKRIVSIGYHGWGSEFIAATPPAHGVPYQCTVSIPFGDIDWLSDVLEEDDTACVIVEQPPQAPPAGYWPALQTLCWQTGTLLILDEVVTGLRYALGGAAERIGISPDIMCLGKALGNGVPVSAMVFDRGLASWFSRDDPVFVSSTHFGNTLGLAAASYVLDHWTQADVYYLWDMGNKLMAGLYEIGYNVQGYAPVSLIQFDNPARRAYFITGMRDRGILMNRPNIPNRAHTAEDVERTLQAAAEVYAEMESVDVEAATAGRMPAVLFANR